MLLPHWVKIESLVQNDFLVSFFLSSYSINKILWKVFLSGVNWCPWTWLNSTLWYSLYLFTNIDRIQILWNVLCYFFPPWTHYLEKKKRYKLWQIIAMQKNWFVFTYLKILLPSYIKEKSQYKDIWEIHKYIGKSLFCIFSISTLILGNICLLDLCYHEYWEGEHCFEVTDCLTRGQWLLYWTFLINKNR